MMESKDKECIFCRISEGLIEADIIYSTQDIIAFKDIDPRAPVHLLVVPRKHIETFNDVSRELIGKCMAAAKNLAEEFNIAESGYRIVINCNKDGGQEVGHLHVHLLGGRKMKWPPG